MAYTPTAWDCGDVVTAEKLNKIEEAIQLLSESGGSTAPLIISYDHEDSSTSPPREYTDTTWQAVYDALEDGRMVLVDISTFDTLQAPGFVAVDFAYLISGYKAGNMGAENYWFYADSASGYLYRLEIK